MVDDEGAASGGLAEDGVAACRARPALREVLRWRRSRDETVEVAYVGGIGGIGGIAMVLPVEATH